MTLRRKFREELDYLRRFGREFSHDNPQLAQFLGEESADPDVERLLEGFGFLTAKLRLKIEDDLPELTHSMLQLLWPNYLRPLPSATIIRFEPVESAITQRQTVPRGTVVLSRPVDGIQCSFRTCTDVDLLPLRIEHVSDAHSREKSILTIDLQFLGNNPPDLMDCERLDFHLSGDDTTARTLYLWMARYLDRIRVEIDGKPFTLPSHQVSFPGFAPEEALLPYPKNAFDGYRILQEYFVFPQRFHCFRLSGLQPFWPSTTQKTLRLAFHFSRPMPPGIRLRDDDLSLYCTPAVNLFEHDAEPLRIDGKVARQPVFPTGQRPDAYEIFSIDDVRGLHRQVEGRRSERLRVFRPFETMAHEVEHADGRSAIYYHTHISNTLNDMGINHSVSFVRADDSEYVASSETVSLSLTCTNRDLPLALDVGDICEGTQTAPPFTTFRNITRPTPSYRPVLDGDLQWSLISNLSLNYLSLLAAEPLKAVLRAYDFAALHDIQHARASSKRLAGIGEASTRPMDWLMKGLPIRGLKTVLNLDQDAFLCEGDLYLFGSVLSHFLALYASINSFHVLEVVNTRSNEHYEWPLQTGKQPLI
ncbi:type VI secretion system baseplate subunit TssF [Paraburkholderia hayleyella]|uniref:type VI secretion system baseplate subunit TssF n=1 Tax=Paraburkholderia hayleyella TaxID=2152889 RepID=UPI00129260A8|nr:type VI secretion system baseplate subunit TssF [Paraburkholderia hayleyella]